MTVMPLHRPYVGRREPSDELLDKVDQAIKGVEACLVEARQALDEARAERRKGDGDSPQESP